jgi:radical SAM superfamily enzyme YgiQ (UPF0313 family)
VQELGEAKKQFGITEIHFEDEIFAMDMRWLAEFVPLYKEKVGLPFLCYIYPVRSVEKILTLLRSAGLYYCCLALESGSERINQKVFQRVYNRELFLHTAEVCKKLGLRFYTDVITYNPYEEEHDLRQTLDVLLDIENTYDMSINKLFVLPGTKMAEQMKKEGLQISQSEKDKLFNYYCRLFWITGITERARPIVNFIQRTRVFKRHPWLINPALIEVAVNPVSSARSLAKNHLPGSVVDGLRRLRGRPSVPLEDGTLAGTETVCR